MTGIRPARSPLQKLDATSLTDRVLDRLVTAISQGYFASGRLPAEPELADRLGVSRTTVRAALQTLDRIGMLERRPGVGTRLRPHVTPEVLALHGLVPFSGLLALRYDVTAECHATTGIDATADQVKRLGSPPEGGFCEIRRVLRGNGRAAFIMVERIPMSSLRRSMSEEDVDLSILTLSRRSFREQIDHAVATLIPRSATSEVAALFEISSGAPHMFVEETFYGASAQPLALSDVTVNPEMIDFSVVRQGVG